MKNVKKNSAFTLVELLVVITVVALMGVISASMYFNATGPLTFFSTFKSIQSTFRQARSFAITNSSITQTPPDRYGVYLDYDEQNNIYEIFMFADDEEGTAFEYSNDTIDISKHFKFSSDEYEISVRSPLERTLDFPMAFYYETGTGDFAAMQTSDINLNATDPIQKKSTNFIAIVIRQLSGNEIERTLVVNQVSGLAEEYLTL